MRRLDRRSLVALVCAAALLPAAPARSQSQDWLRRASEEGAGPRPSWAGELAFLSGNAVLGGLTAGVFQTLRGGSFWPAFRAGVVGGAVAYTGRRIAVERFSGAGLLGREVAAVGGSLVQNAADARAAFERVVIPFGLVRFYVQSDRSSAAATHVRVKVDFPTLLATTYLVVRENADFDLSASLSSGTPVFRTRVRYADGYWRGDQAAGVIWLHGNPDDPAPDADRSGVFAHERVHVLQYDFSLVAWSDAGEAWLSKRIPGGGWVDRHLDLGLHLGVWGLANWLLPYEQRPWEQEAFFLSRVRSGG